MAYTVFHTSTRRNLQTTTANLCFEAIKRYWSTAAAFAIGFSHITNVEITTLILVNKDVH